MKRQTFLPMPISKVIHSLRYEIYKGEYSQRESSPVKDTDISFFIIGRMVSA